MMVKVLECRHFHADCAFRATGQTFEEVVLQAAAHAKNEHGLKVDAEFLALARASMSEEGE